MASNLDNIVDICALTPLQSGFLFQLLYEKNSDVYFTQSLEYLKNIKPNLLKKAWNTVANKHDILKMGMLWENLEESVSYMLSHVEIPFEEHDWKNIENQEEKLEEFIKSDRSNVFDLTKAPLMRIALIRLTEVDYVMVWSSHHIILDGWSSAIVLGEVFQIYTQLLKKESPKLIERRSYRDYIGWLKRQDEVKAEEFWKCYFSSIEGSTRLSFKGMVEVDDVDYKELMYELGESETLKLQEFCSNNNLTINTLLVGILGIVLSKYLNQKEVVIGMVTSGRGINLSGIESMVGLFVNTLPVRMSPINRIVIDYLTSLQKEIQELDEHGYMSLAGLLKWSEYGKDLFNVLFVYENYPPAETLYNSEFFIKSKNAQKIEYPLSVMAHTSHNKLSWNLYYQTEHFDRNIVERLSKHMKKLLKEIITTPLKEINRLDILTETEKQQLLVDWNDTVAEYPKDKCIHELFEEQVEKSPDAVAVVFDNKHLTYRELNERSNQLANYLRKNGVAADTLIAICVDRSLEMIIGIIGILKAGGAYVPLDPTYPEDRLKYMMEDSGVKLVITKEYFENEEIAKESSNNLVKVTSPQNLAYVIYTSGSTGKPKGVQVCNESVVNHLLVRLKNLSISESDIVAQIANYCFDISVWQILAVSLAGGKLILIKQEEQKSIDVLGHLAAKNLVTILEIVPSLLSKQSGLEKLDCVKNLILTGEAFKEEAYFDFRNITDSNVFNAYGPTESTISCTLACINDHLSIGRPISNTQIYILDSAQNPVPQGVSGEICIGGIGLARGYLNRPDLTAEKFMANPFGNGERLYRTGDLGKYLADGDIEFLGRIDNQVKIRGFRIELEEIESAINDCADIRTSVVLAREDADGNKQLVAYVIPKPVNDLEELYKLETQTRDSISVFTGNKVAGIVEAIRNSISKTLPDYMMPSLFMVLDQVPLTPNGKTDSKLLLTLDTSKRISAHEYVAPRTEIEEKLCEIWQEVLYLDKVDVNDDFFEIGGHSLLATRIISKIRAELNADLPLKKLFEHPTIAALASVVDGKESRLGEKIPPLIAQKKPKNISLSFAQQRLWVIDKLLPEKALYNISYSVRLVGDLDYKALEEAVNKLIERHESFRTNFFETAEGKGYQVISPEWKFKLIAEEASEKDIEKIAKEEAESPFHLTDDHLLRIRLLKIGNEDHVLLITMHHIISDGWSTSIFLDELKELYNNQNIILPKLPITYTDYAIWQRSWLKDDVLENQLNYWKEHLQNSPDHLDLPLDYKRPTEMTYAGERIDFELKKTVYDGILKLAEKTSTTVFMVMFAAVNCLLHKYTYQENIVIGTPIANRHYKETEGLIGFFVNTLALRTHFDKDMTFMAVLEQVKKSVTDGYENQDIPFEYLVDKLNIERRLNVNPLFQVMVTTNKWEIKKKNFRNVKEKGISSNYAISKFDLEFDALEDEGHFYVSIGYSKELFKSETIDRMSSHLEKLLEEIVENPKKTVDRIEILTATEKQQLLVDWNDTTSDYPKDKCIHESFEEQVERSPDAVAVVYDDKHLTYRELNERSNQLANYLRKCGVAADTLVAICIDRSLEMIIGMMGILKSGGAYVPLDPTYPEDRLKYMLEDTGAKILLTQQHLQEKIQNLTDEEIKITSLDTNESIQKESVNNLVRITSSQNLAYVIYTSGSTGKPKGVQINHRGVVNTIFSQIREFMLIERNSALQIASFSFDAFVSEIMTSLISGKTIELIESKQGIEKFLNKKLVDIGTIPVRLLKTFEKVNSHLDTLVIAGESSSRDILDKCSHIENFINAYGPTEGSICSTMLKINSADVVVNSIGRPISNTQIYILDSAQNPVPLGVSGEIYIGGVGLARGYLSRPDLTAEKFIANPFGNGERLYKTGDLGKYLSDGNIEFLGRIDNQVKIRGFRIELGEIESTINESEDVKTSVVLAREDSDGNKQLVTYIVPKSVNDLEESYGFETQTKEKISVYTGENVAGIVEAIRNSISKTLPDYMIPSFFVMLEKIPLTPNGKTDSKLLLTLDTGKRASIYEYIAPRNEIEERLRNIWQDVLRLDMVGINDNFFKIGGDSILAIQLISKARKNGLTFSVKDVFNCQTISKLSEVTILQKEEEFEYIPQAFELLSTNITSDTLQDLLNGE